SCGALPPKDSPGRSVRGLRAKFAAVMNLHFSSVDNSFLILEAGSALLIVLLAFAAPQISGRIIGSIEKWAGRLARKQTAAVILIGLLPPLIRLSLLPVATIPQPE